MKCICKFTCQSQNLVTLITIHCTNCKPQQILQREILWACSLSVCVNFLFWFICWAICSHFHIIFKGNISRNTFTHVLVFRGKRKRSNSTKNWIWNQPLPLITPLKKKNKKKTEKRYLPFPTCRIHKVVRESESRGVVCVWPEGNHSYTSREQCCIFNHALNNTEHAMTRTLVFCPKCVCV